MKSPISDSRIAAYVETLKKGGEDCITDWKLYHAIQDNPFVKNKVDAYFNTEREEQQQLLREKQAAHLEKENLAAANRQRHEQVVQTCREYRLSMKALYQRRKGRYHRLSYLKASHARNERFKQSNWIASTVSVLTWRKYQVRTWCPDPIDAEFVISQIKNPLEPWNEVR